MTETTLQLLPLDQLVESPTNPRHRFDAAALAELTDSIAAHGVLTPLLVRPKRSDTDAFLGYEIIAGARRYRAATEVGLAAVPAQVRDLTDTQALEIQVIENLQRVDVHPLDEGLGYQALLAHPGYDVASVAAKVGKSASYVHQRVKLADLVDELRTAFFDDEIQLGHALLLARLAPADQHALRREGVFHWRSTADGRRIAHPVAELRGQIAQRVHLTLRHAPWDLTDAALFPEAGACSACPKRTSVNPSLFPDITDDDCTDRACYRAKKDAHFAGMQAAKTGRVVLLKDDAPKDGISVRGTTPAERAVPAKKGSCEYLATPVYVGGRRDGKTGNPVCIERKCAVHHPETANAKKGKKAAASRTSGRGDDKERERRAQTETARRMALRAAVYERVDGLVREDLVTIACEMYSTAEFDLKDLWPALKCASTPWDKKKFARHATIAALSDADLARLILDVVLAEEVHVSGHGEEALVHLPAIARARGLDPDAILDAHDASVAVAPPEKPATTKAATKKATKRTAA